MATHADISGNLTIGALQAVRRNASNTGFEAYTTTSEVSYLVYAALLTQAGTIAPVAAVLQNTIGSITWARSGAGQYTATLTGSSFSAGNTFILTSALRSVGITGMSLIYCGVNTGGGNIDLVTAGLSVGPPVSIAQYDDLLTSAPIEIRIYLSSMTGRAAGVASVVGTMSGPVYGAVSMTATVVATARGSGALTGGATSTATARGALTA